ncbi:sugar phosphate isomerase/epimerase family protein [Fibrella forsythiae]|uniref:Sugar phosphate isomerase/epimerase n=1 Tax=Fibrella forsythiae TaxID=2817061 RepID=A0ABS3JS00_9BACT|nr:sugar phosphate isomerase/epimerase family protein [Fibrella forsythiae]MBO0952800.1 sugar phosphate isomerase/epimerase [Fibrella forsythiae]
MSIPFRFGAEAYTWFMNNNGQTHANRQGHMIDITAQAGFAGIEPIFNWMGDLPDAGSLGQKLAEKGVELAAIALALDWNGTEESEHERREADRAIDLLTHFPGAILCTVQKPTGRHDIEQRRRNLVNIVNRVSRRAFDRGVPCSFHPNSPHSSITRTEEDYRVILESLDTSVTGWTPDVGHLINGGMDPLTKMKEYASMINLVHFKDWNGEPEFALLGNGKVDFVGITRWLIERQYSGWIICEDEGPEAMNDPDGVTLHDGRWVYETLLPSVVG